MVNRNGSLHKTKRAKFKTRLLKLFNHQDDTNFNFGTKIMYGSDWHMLFRHGINDVFLSCYKEFFSDAEFNLIREDFFFNNANRFLNYKLDNMTVHEDVV